MINNGFHRFTNFVKSEKKTITDSLALMTSNFTGSILVFISGILLARILQPTLFGTYKTIINFILFLPALSELGINTTLVKYGAEFIAQDKKSKFWFLIKKLLGFRLIINVVLAVAIIIFQKPLAHNFLKDTNLSFYLILGAVFLISGFLDNIKPLVSAFKNFKLLAKTQFILNFSWAVLVVLGAYFFGITGAIWGIILSYPLSNFLNIKFLIKKQLAKKTEAFPLSPILKKYTLPIYLLSLPNLLSLALIPVLALFYSQTLIGYFSLSLIFHNLAVQIPNAISGVVFPEMSEFNAKKDFASAKIKLKRIYLIYLPFILITLPLILIFTRPLINLILPTFLEAVLMIKVMFASGLAFGLLVIYGSYLTALAKFKKLTVITLFLTIMFYLIAFSLLNLTK